MHKADFRDISKGEIVKKAEEMKKNGCTLTVITGYVDKEGNPVISYCYDVDGELETYKLSGEKNIPTITGVYGTAAEWFEEEISELMDVKFEGLEMKGRLFLPDEFDGSGQIIVSSLSELRDKK